MQNSFETFLNQHQNSQAAQEIVTLHQQEIEMYQRYKSYYSYGMYIAKKTVTYVVKEEGLT